MKYKTFKYKNYGNCSFHVCNYMANSDAMYIGILDKDGSLVSACTINEPNYSYLENTATIKNYTENTGMTNFLLKLGVIEQVLTKKYFRMFDTFSKDSIDFCEINIDTLKKYSSKFNYKYSTDY